jgi:hypothetical protein
MACYAWYVEWAPLALTVGFSIWAVGFVLWSKASVMHLLQLHNDVVAMATDELDKLALRASKAEAERDAWKSEAIGLREMIDP